MKRAHAQKAALILLFLLLIGAAAAGLGSVLSRRPPPEPETPPTRLTADAELRGTPGASRLDTAPAAPLESQPTTFQITPLDMAAFSSAAPAQVASPYRLSRPSGDPRRGGPVHRRPPHPGHNRRQGPPRSV